MTIDKTESPQIYVACLASYNAGIHFGAWIDANQDPDDILEAITALVLRKSPSPNVMVTCPDCKGSGNDAEVDSNCPTCKGKGKVPSAEEWAIHGSEGFMGVAIGEHHDLEEISDLAEGIVNNGEAFAAYANYVGPDHATVEDFQERYRGAFRSKEEWAEEFLTDTGAMADMPQNLYHYFDFEKYARDCELGRDVVFIEVDCGDVIVFDAH